MQSSQDSMQHGVSTSSHQSRAGGQYLNLQAANPLVYCGSWWKLSWEQRAERTIYRMMSSPFWIPSSNFIAGGSKATLARFIPSATRVILKSHRREWKATMNIPLSNHLSKMANTFQGRTRRNQAAVPDLHNLPTRKWEAASSSIGRLSSTGTDVASHPMSLSSASAEHSQKRPRRR
ncbi:global transactivator [Fusarium sporotrichioides]|uniref:Global transactivator n=1 Tax=Fusarium sporotrichioides TaxID=5514 RepID=A0A395SCK4_FUSSP|nr:global transactivator [Fusarium sporotrichioides]